VLDAVRDGRIEPIASWELVEELAEVLQRPKLSRYAVSRQDAEDLLLILAPALPEVDVDVSLRDPDDAPVVAAAIAGRADAIVTGNSDLLDDAQLHSWLADRGVRLLTPAELLLKLES
jgi:uncharacterized protein